MSIAYQVVGEGPNDIVFVPGFVSHLDLQWGVPEWVAFIERLARFSRVIIFDKRGTGLSDPVFAVPTLEERMDDVAAVMDAAGSRRAAFFGYSEGGMMSLLFAATYPDRASALILFGTYAQRADPGSLLRPSWERLRACLASWGDGTTLEVFAPSIAGGEIQRRLRGFVERAAASPAMALRLIECLETMDVSAVLPTIHAPTLVLHRTNDFIPLAAGRYIADHVPTARLVELSGIDHLPWVGDAEGVLGEIEQFLTGSRTEARGERLITTVLFTDLVGSTEAVVRLGDARWRALREAHDGIVREQLDRFGGTFVDSAGDGVFATFEGPVRAIRCARAIAEAIGMLGLKARAGVHSGEVQRGTKPSGLAVHIGARIMARAGPDEILVSDTVRGLTVGSGTAYADRGTHELKGVPGLWHLFAVLERVQEPHIDPDRRLGVVDRSITAASRRVPALMRGIVSILAGR